jgi:hypothetical protein
MLLMNTIESAERVAAAGGNTAPAERVAAAGGTERVAK